MENHTSHNLAIAARVVRGFVGLALGLVMGLTVPAHAQECDPVEAAKLLAADGAVGDWFGTSVSVSGDTVIVGAWLDNDRGTDSGSAYVFETVGGVWTQTAKLTAADGAVIDYFGSAVCVSGDTAVVGAYGDDDYGSRSGSAYVFEKVGGVWIQTAKLTAEDAWQGDFFGRAVAISGGTVIVGADEQDDLGDASGSAYVFERIGGAWTQTAKLSAHDGAAFDHFGDSVSMHGDLAVVGAYGDDDHGSKSGSVYVFGRVGGIWVQSAKLTASDGAADDRFGHAVSVSVDTAIIGANWVDQTGPATGSAYAFEKVDGAWTQTAKLTDWCGHAVSMSGDTAVVGAFSDYDYGDDSGSAYVFKKVGGVWIQITKLTAADGAADDRFGYSVSVGADTVIAGADQDDDNGLSSGSAYVFDLNCGCPADLNGDGGVDALDLLAYLNAWATGDPIADWNDDGTINTQDFLAYLYDWAAGCP